MAEMTMSYLLVKEFETVTAAHRAAGLLASECAKNGESEFKLIEVSPTAGGAWVCAWTSSSSVADNLSRRFLFESLKVNDDVLNALLSLTGKVSDEASAIAILELESVAPLIARATAIATMPGNQDIRLHEIRVKRAGPRGAYAFFWIRANDIEQAQSVAARFEGLTVIALEGEYEKFFR
ncbi:MAG: hypothetical protein RBT63_05220 [Bdellovibrionales bacterium]|jgi:hypothetical protein|nr:hypothetical protein [Bdellovibrionales bacterium]